MNIDRERLVLTLGVFGLLSFAFFAWLGTAGAYLGLFLTCIAFILAIPFEGVFLRKDGVVVLVLAFYIYFSIRTIWSIVEYPELMSEQINAALQWGLLGLFVPFAWWTSSSKGRIYIVLVLLFVGFFLGVLKLTDWQACDVLGERVRCGFGFQIILGALLLGTALLGLLMFAPRIVGRWRMHWSWLLRFFLWLIALAICSYFILLTQTRAVWLGMCVVLPVALVWRYKATIKLVCKGQGKGPLLLVALVVTIFVGILYSSQGVIQTRVSQAVDEGIGLASSLGEPANQGAIGLRLSMYEKGYHIWLERPWFGWGVGGVNYPMFLDNINESNGYLTHFHSTYLEILVRFGIVGGLLLLAIVVYLIYEMFIRYRSGEIPIDLYCFLNASLALFLFWSIFDFQVGSGDWRFLSIILFGLSYSTVIRRFA